MNHSYWKNYIFWWKGCQWKLTNKTYNWINIAYTKLWHWGCHSIRNYFSSKTQSFYSRLCWQFNWKCMSKLTAYLFVHEVFYWYLSIVTGLNTKQIIQIGSNLIWLENWQLKIYENKSHFNYLRLKYSHQIEKLEGVTFGREKYNCTDIWWNFILFFYIYFIWTDNIKYVLQV